MQSAPVLLLVVVLSFLALPSYAYFVDNVRQRCECDFSGDCNCAPASLQGGECLQIFDYCEGSYTNTYYYLTYYSEQTYYLEYYHDSACSISQSSEYVYCDECNDYYSTYYIGGCKGYHNSDWKWWVVLLIVIGCLVGMIIIGGLIRYLAFRWNYEQVNEESGDFSQKVIVN